MTTVGLGQAYISFEKENNSNLSEYGLYLAIKGEKISGFGTVRDPF